MYDEFVRAIEDRGAASKDRVAQIAAEAEESEIIYPAYAALAAWGQDGVDRIVQTAVRGRKVKHRSVALTTLTGLAVLGRLPNVVWPMMDSRFAEYINDKIDEPAIRPIARRALHDVILAAPSDELLIAMSQSHMHLSQHGEELATEVVAAMAGKWFRFGNSALRELEQLIQDTPDDEPAFQSYFCRYPQVLDPMAAQVWDRPNFHGALIPDFVIRRADDSYLVVEIETPGKLLVTKAGQLSAQAIQAEKQALDYETFLSERVLEARHHFPGFGRAECLVVIGQERDLSDGQSKSLRMANARRQDLKVVGFDWLVERARRVVSNVSEGRIEVIERHRLV